MQIYSQSKNVRVSPRKLRMVADLIKLMKPNEALVKLQFLPKSGAVPMKKTLQSAIADAQNNFKKTIGELKIKNILINEGMKMKRQDKSHGARYNSGLIQRRTAHIKIILEA